jgi:flagellin
MAMNDISLTTGMRSNLLSLQGTVDLLNRTQNRLSSGKKVNSAIDNPVSFFASQALTARASTIDALKDGMGQAIQTIQSADKGIKAITAMIEQAKGIGQAALSAAEGTGMDTETVTLNSVAIGDTIQFVDAAGTTLTAGPTAAVVTTYNSFTLTFGGEALETGDSVDIGGVTFTASIGGTAVAGDKKFIVTGVAANDVEQLETAVDNFFGTLAYTTTVTANALAITPGEAGLNVNSVALNTASATEIAITSSTSTTAGALTALQFQRTGDDTTDAQNLANLINNNTAIHTTAGYTATASEGVLTLSKATDITAGNILVSDAATMVEAAVAGATATAELTALQAQYNEMLVQISAVADDSGYKGKNLLANDNLVVQFEGNTLTVNGFDASAIVGLGITAATWTAGGNIDTDIGLLDDALVTIRQNSSTLAGNLSVITVRNDFSTNMINTLIEGSDKLTLADSNEEGANMLMLQTRQTLATTALSLSAQAAQSVLRLFQ